MSGGHFTLNGSMLLILAHEIMDEIEKNDCMDLDIYGFRVGRGFDADVIDRMLTTVKLLTVAGNALQRVDYLLSHDDSPDAFRKRWDNDVLPLLHLDLT